MKFFHPKVVDTSVLFKRKNGCKMKLKNLADKILKIVISKSSEEDLYDLYTRTFIKKVLVGENQ